MAFYENMIALAKRLIAKRGQKITWIQNRQSEPDPLAPWNPQPVAPVRHENVVIAFLPVERYAFETFRDRDKTDIQEGHVTGYMAQQVFKPNKMDTVERDGVTLTIEDITTINPDSRDILHIILFRQ